MLELFRPEQWNDFFLMVGGGAAALTGLVFVAISINLEIITRDIMHKSRAVGTLAGFAAVFMICAFVLIGGQSYKAIGVEWLLGSTFAAYFYYRGIVRSVKKGVTLKKMPLRRLVLATISYLGQIVGSIIFIFGHTVGLYIASLAMVVLFASLISGAWLLIIGIHNKTQE
jgi:hypothetical protein